MQTFLANINKLLINIILKNYFKILKYYTVKKIILY